ncbi:MULTISPECIES: DUF2732 family protein [Providencia]|uniref:DUF2732 family protein n=1 Tax=Providencia TaxID=586 RepID=UPI001121D56A|nr:DUF2732 family protein [Providencia stuartii]
MKNIEKKQIKIGTNSRSAGKTTVANLFISRVREDERKSLFNRFSDRLETLADTAALKRMSAEEIINLIRGESECFSNAAAELNHV